jgi:two-component system sensor histidine kinase HydH
VAALAALGEMVATVAHEWRNLLGSVELYAGLLAERAAGVPELDTLCGRVVAGLTRLRAAAANLLAVPRRAAHDPAPVDLRHLALDTLDAVRRSLAGTGVRLRTRLTPHKVWVAGDADRLRQALLNLLLNALEALGERGTLAVHLRVRDGAAVVAVRDTGAGMDPATLARATEPFFSTRPHGTGLGLAVVREVAEAHGARLRIRSRPGRGTAVHLSFPLAGADAGGRSPDAP